MYFYCQFVKIYFAFEKSSTILLLTVTKNCDAISLIREQRFKKTSHIVKWDFYEDFYVKRKVFSFIKTMPLKTERHQTRVSLLLELVSDVYLTEIQTN